MRRIRLVLSLLLAGANGALAQTPSFDSSGNKLLSGVYYFREVVYVVGSSDGSLSRALALYGNISFDGAGTYTIKSQPILDSKAARLSTFSTTGAYSIAASGYGYMASPASSGDFVYGTVSNGIFIGSSTESDFNDLFVAAPLASPQPVNSSFKGNYPMVYFNAGAQPSLMTSAAFQLNPDGNGGMGDVAFNGYFAGGGSKAFPQTTRNVRYSFSNGGCAIFFPVDANANFISETEYVYLSPDGNFVFGGSPTNFDFILGVRAAPPGSTQKLNGLYYQAGINLDASAFGSLGYVDLDTYYGAFNTSAGSAISQERFSSAFNPAALSSTYSGTVPASITGTYTDTVARRQYTVAADGGIRIGLGNGPYLGINVALRAPALSGEGVFLNPAGVINSASFAPFTEGVSAGEFVTLFGSGLAESTVVASTLPFPGTLGGVQVLVNDTPAPLYYVSPGQIAAIIPYGLTGGIARIQVVNRGLASNAVTQFVALTTPGIFTLTSNGLGPGAVEHADGSVVTAEKPAQPGETLAMFVTGLGPVKPTIADGAAGPVEPLSKVTSTVLVRVNGALAKVTYSGLAPFLAGLYQVNFEVPANARVGDNSLELDGPDSYTVLATVRVGTPQATAAAVSAQPASGMVGRGGRVAAPTLSRRPVISLQDFR